MSTYPVLRKFAREHVTSGEIDAIYPVIYRMRHEHGWAAQMRFATHLFLFYDAEEAAKCAFNKSPFWSYVREGYPTFKRGKARRHFRGENGLKAIEILESLGNPHAFWEYMACSEYAMMADKVARTLRGAQIGPYFQWKAMDILDRCLSMPVKLNYFDAVKYLPDEPRKGAQLIWGDKHIGEVLNEVVNWISDLPAPGAPTRNCSYAEAETILCAISGLMKGSYHVGDDIDGRHKELADYPDLKILLPPKQDWTNYVCSLDSAFLSD
jgi:hypothetical protein